MEIRHNREALIQQIHAAGGRVNGTTVRCPFHRDTTPSASLHCDRDGVWRMTCHASSCRFSGDIYDILARIAGKTPAQILSERRSQAKPIQTTANGLKSILAVKETVYSDFEEIVRRLNGSIEAKYFYTHPDTGNVDLLVIRYNKDGKKSFSQAYQTSKGWINAAPPKPWPIYNRAGIRDADPVVVVEGEKCAQALIDLGIPATTSPCGATQAHCADWSALAGKLVYLWPDNDHPGREYMDQVAGILQRLDPPVQIRRVYPVDLFPKADVYDYLESLGPADQRTKIQAVLDALADSKSDSIADEVESLINDTISGKRRSVPWPWPLLSNLTKALLPGTVTLVCGDPGATKSFLALSSLIQWHRENIRACVYELEEDRAYHLHRVLALETGMGELLDDNWIAANPEIARDVFRKNKHMLESIGRNIWAAPDQQVTLKELTEWTRSRASEGYRVIVIDPVTAAAQSAQPWIDDLEFLINIKNIARQHSASILLVTHPRQINKQISVGIDNMAGSRAYSRFSQTVLWIERKSQPIKVEVVDGLVEANRIIHIVKARNGTGHGLSIAYEFNDHTLKFDEKGVIIRGVHHEAQRKNTIPAF